MFESKVRELLEAYPDLDELFDVLDIPVEDVIEFLLENGLVVLPPWLGDTPSEEDEIT